MVINILRAERQLHRSSDGFLRIQTPQNIWASSALADKYVHAHTYPKKLRLNWVI